MDLPRWFERAACGEAVRLGLSLEDYAVRAVVEKVGAQAEAFFAELGRGGNDERAVSFSDERRS